MRRLILFSQFAFLVAILASCSVGPPPKFTESNVNIVMAGNAGPEGPSCITDTFTLAGRVFAYTTFTWDAAGREGGPHKIEAKWYRGEKLLSAGVRRVVLGRPPYHALFSVPGTDLGVGKARVQMYADGLFVGSKTFEVVKVPVLIHRVQPVYPVAARKARIEGIVIMEGIVTASGGVEEVRVLQSVDPLLDAAAVRAVQQWKYEPATLEGKPVRVCLTLTAAFSPHD
jgi:TonB family protein